MDLEGNSIGDEGADLLGMLFTNANSMIRRINLRFNSVTNEGAWRLVARAFEKNRQGNNKAVSGSITKVEKLNLYNNKGVRLRKMVTEAWKYT